MGTQDLILNVYTEKSHLKSLFVEIILILVEHKRIFVEEK
jgi:hypothetical protein